MTTEQTPASNAVATTEPQQATLPAVRAPQRASLVAGGQVRAIVPQTIEEAYRLANAIVSADMAPKSYKRDANAVMVGIMHGMEVGFTPMASLQSIAVINGMPAIWGDGALALIQASGLLEDMKEWLDDDTQTFYVEMKRRGRPTWIKQQFSWADAVKAKLVGKDTYQQYGRRMLQRRARAWAMTDGFADVLRGLHIREAMVLGADGQEDETAPPQRPTRSSVAAQAVTAETIVEDTEQADAAAAAMDAQYAATMTGRMPDDPEAESDPTEVDAGEVEPEVDESEPAVEYDFPKIRKEIEGKLLKAGKPEAIDELTKTYASELHAMKTQSVDMARELSATFAARRKKLEG